ncbi:hypothetical protein B0E54_04735 [Micromonospora sp. MH99]|nr:hypothetical protein [Micromonospora sp. MH99]
MFMSAAVTVTVWAGSSRGIIVAASSSFWTLAGVPYSCGPQPPSTWPESRSATSHEVAVIAGGVPAPGGTTRPLVASPAPPTTRASGTAGGGEGRGGRDIAGAGTCGHRTVGTVAAAPVAAASVAATGVGAAAAGTGPGASRTADAVTASSAALMCPTLVNKIARRERLAARPSGGGPLHQEPVASPATPVVRRRSAASVAARVSRQPSGGSPPGPRAPPARQAGRRGSPERPTPFRSGRSRRGRPPRRVHRRVPDAEPRATRRVRPPDRAAPRSRAT